MTLIVNKPEQLSVLGTPLAVTDYAAFTHFCQSQVDDGKRLSIDFTNTQIVTMRRHEPAFKALTKDVDYFVPDGMPLVWCLNRMGATMQDRVYGPAFFKYCVTHSPRPYKHYFLGGSQDCLDKLQANLLAEQPDLHIVGSHHGYFDESDENRIVAEILALSPDFIWVGLGTPKQQAWIQRNLNQIQRGLVLAVGFAFDVNAGTKKDAPMWMQRLGLTWFYRICCEPKRLIPRYVKYNSLFLWYLMRDKLAVSPKR